MSDGFARSLIVWAHDLVRKPVPTFADRAFVAKGRTKGDAPEIDGNAYVSSRRPLKVGEIVTAKIERADAYDLHGSIVGF